MRSLLLLALLASGCSQAEAGGFPWRRPIVASTATYQSTVLSDTPTAYWPMQEASGSLTDASGNGTTATASGTPVYHATALLAGEGFSINMNTAGHFDYSRIDCTGAFTVEFWISTTSNTLTFTNAAIGHDGGFSGIQFNSQKFTLYDGSTDVLIDASTFTSASGNVYFAATRDGSNNLKLYRNGSQVATGTSANTFYNSHIGYQTANSPIKMSDVAVYNGTALSAARISAHYAFH